MSPDERHMDYRTTIQDIRDHKSNQWRISHYGLIAQAAIVAFHAQFETLSPYGKLALVTVSLAALCAFISLVHEAQTRIARGRRRRQALLSDPSEDWRQFTEKFRDMQRHGENRARQTLANRSKVPAVSIRHPLHRHDHGPSGHHGLGLRADPY